MTIQNKSLNYPFPTRIWGILITMVHPNCLSMSTQRLGVFFCTGLLISLGTDNTVFLQKNIYNNSN